MFQVANPITEYSEYFSEVEPSLSETFAGYVVLCYIDGEYIKSKPFASKDDAEEFSEKWNSKAMVYMGEGEGGTGPTSPAVNCKER